MRRWVGIFSTVTFFVSSGNVVKAEYVAFKLDQSTLTRQSTIKALTQKEFKDVYKIISSFKWPMNVFTFYASPQEFPIKYDVPYAEEAFIRAKVKEINKDYDIAFIPDAIYESAFLGRDAELASDGGQKEREAQEIQATVLTGTPQYKAKLLEDKVREVVLANLKLGDEQAYKKVLEYMYTLNLHPTVVDISFKINNEIVGILKRDLPFIRTLAPERETVVPKSKIPFKKSEETKLKSFLSEAIRSYFQRFDDPKASWNTLLNKNFLKQIIQKVAQMEQKAAQNNDALLFRGSQGGDSPLRMKPEAYKKLAKPSPDHREKILLEMKKDSKELSEAKTLYSISEAETLPYSISFGHSLMAGLAIESGGNVYRFMTIYGGGYALKINKGAFFDKGRPYVRDMFFIPPHGTVFSYYATDDLFHPRTKVGLGRGVENGNATIEQLQLKGDTKTAWVVGVAQRKGWEGLAADLATYITKEGNTEVIMPLGKTMSGEEILGTFHTELLHFKKHKENFSPVLQEIEKGKYHLKQLPAKKAE